MLREHKWKIASLYSPFTFTLEYKDGYADGEWGKKPLQPGVETSTDHLVPPEYATDKEIAAAADMVTLIERGYTRNAPTIEGEFLDIASEVTPRRRNQRVKKWRAKNQIVFTQPNYTAGIFGQQEDWAFIFGDKHGEGHWVKRPKGLSWVDAKTDEVEKMDAIASERKYAWNLREWLLGVDRFDIPDDSRFRDLEGAETDLVHRFLDVARKTDYRAGVTPQQRAGWIRGLDRLPESNPAKTLEDAAIKRKSTAAQLRTKTLSGMRLDAKHAQSGGGKCECRDAGWQHLDKNVFEAVFGKKAITDPPEMLYGDDRGKPVIYYFPDESVSLVPVIGATETLKGKKEEQAKRLAAAADKGSPKDLIYPAVKGLANTAMPAREREALVKAAETFTPKDTDEAPGPKDGIRYIVAPDRKRDDPEFCDLVTGGGPCAFEAFTNVLFDMGLDPKLISASDLKKWQIDWRNEINRIAGRTVRPLKKFTKLEGGVVELMLPSVQQTAALRSMPLDAEIILSRYHIDGEEVDYRGTEGHISLLEAVAKAREKGWKHCIVSVPGTPHAFGIILDDEGKGATLVDNGGLHAREFKKWILEKPYVHDSLQVQAITCLKRKAETATLGIKRRKREALDITKFVKRRARKPIAIKKATATPRARAVVR